MALQQFIYQHVGCPLDTCQAGKFELAATETVQITLDPKNPDWTLEFTADVVSVTKTDAGRDYLLEYDDAVLGAGGVMFEGCDIASIEPYCCCDELDARVTVLEALADSDTTYTISETLTTNPDGSKTKEFTLTGTDGSVQVFTFTDTDTVDVSQLSAAGFDAGGNFLLSHTTTAGNTTIPIPVGVQTVTTNTQADGDIEIIADGVVIGLFPADDDSGNVTEVINVDGSTTYTHIPSGFSWTTNLPSDDTAATYDPATQTITFADGQTKQITDCCVTDFQYNPTGGVGGTPVYEITVTETTTGATSVLTAVAGVLTDIEQNAAGDWEVFENGVLVETITDSQIADTDTNASIVDNGDGTTTITNNLGQSYTSGATSSETYLSTIIEDVDGRQQDATPADNKLLTDRTINATRQHSVAGVAGLSVAAMDSNHSADGGVTAVTTDHDTLVQASANVEASGVRSSVETSANLINRGVSSTVSSTVGLNASDQTFVVPAFTGGTVSYRRGIIETDSSNISVTSSSNFDIINSQRVSYQASSASKIENGVSITFSSVSNSYSLDSNQCSLISSGRTFLEGSLHSGGIGVTAGAHIKDSTSSFLIAGSRGDANDTPAVPGGFDWNFMDSADSCVGLSGRGNVIRGRDNVQGYGSYNAIEAVVDTNVPAPANGHTFPQRSYVGGLYARVAHTGCHTEALYSGGTLNQFSSQNHGEFAVRATGGVRFVTNQTNNAIGVALAPNGSSWTTLSDPAQKDFVGETEDALGKLNKLSVQDGHYKEQEMRRVAKMRNLKGKKQSGESEFEEVDLEEQYFEDTKDRVLRPFIRADEWAKLGYGLGDGKTVEFNDVSVLLIKAVQELSSQNETLVKRLDAIENSK